MIACRSEGVPARTERPEVGPRRVSRIDTRRPAKASGTHGRPFRLEGTLIAHIGTLIGVCQYPYYHSIGLLERTVGSSASKHALSCAQSAARSLARREQTRQQWSRPGCGVVPALAGGAASRRAARGLHCGAAACARMRQRSGWLGAPSIRCVGCARSVCGVWAGGEYMACGVRMGCMGCVRWV